MVFMLYARTEKRKADDAIKKLVGIGAYAKGYRSFSDGDFVFIPVTQKPKGKWDIIELNEEKKAKPKNLKEALAEKLGEKAAADAVSSFDIIGDMAIIEISPELKKHERKIADSIMEIHKNVKTVAKKAGTVRGRYRIRPLKVIAGEKRTATEYREHGCRMRLDAAKVYFSVRLSHERKRIAELVGQKENILALFAGVGPFPLVIAKKRQDARIVAVELNPEAVKFMNENIKLNRIKNITVEEGDARKIVISKYADFADRILMPLPRSADRFLDAAFAGAKDGCIVHIYSFGTVEDPYSDIEKKIAAEARKAGATVKIANRKIVRPFAPGVVQVVVDFRVRKQKPQKYVC